MTMEGVTQHLRSVHAQAFRQAAGFLVASSLPTQKLNTVMQRTAYV